MVVVVMVLLAGGCSVQKDQLATARDILMLAREDRVEGRMDLSVNGMIEAGFNEGIYFGSPGSRLDAELTFGLRDIGPDACATQPCPEDGQ